MALWKRSAKKALNTHLSAPEVPITNAAAPPHPTPSRTATIFADLYGRDATQDELSRMADYNVGAEGSWVGTAHRIIGIFDRQSHSTPVIVRFGPENVGYFDVEGFCMALDNADSSISMSIVRDGGIERDVTAFLKRTLKPGMKFVDVGANIGFFSLLGANLVGPTGSVEAFEPNSENCRLLMLSRERNGFGHLRINAVALSNNNGSAFFSPHLGSNGSFTDQAADQLMNPQCMVIPVMRLDDVLEGPIDVIKIDVEGAEALVFEGASRLLSKYRPVIVSEFQVEMLTRISKVQPRDYLQRMKSLGYDLSRLAGSTTSEIPVSDIDKFLSDDIGDMWQLHELVFRPHETM